jgi:hypothetical protein
VTPAQADRAIKSGRAVAVTSPDSAEPFLLTITSRNRRIVYGTYECDGRTREGAFERGDLELVL